MWRGGTRLSITLIKTNIHVVTYAVEENDSFREIKPPN